MTLREESREKTPQPIVWVRTDNHPAVHPRMPVLREEHVSTMGWIQTACFRVRWNELEDLRHLRANYEKHTQAIYFVFGPRGLFEEAKALKSEEQKGRAVGCESSIMMTMFHEALVSSSCRDTKTVCKPERISTCIYQEAVHTPACQQSLIYVNVLMLFHWENTIWGSLDWWCVQMDWNYVQFVFFHSGSFEYVYVSEGYACTVW